MKKRILSLALAICMLMSAMPVSHAGILSAGNSDTASVESSADEILSSGGILSSGDESSAWEPLPEQELSQGILSSGEGELFESELSQGILSSGEEENPGDELYQGILSPGSTEEFPEEPEIETEDRPGSGGLLVVQCGECGYLDNNHAKDCPVICPPVIKLPVIPVEERKPAIVYSETYFDTYAQLMTAETLEDFEATMDGLTDDQQDELFDLLSANEQEALDELEDTLTRQAIAEEPQKIITHAPATVESRSVALSAARRAALQQLGYELIVNVFGKIVETIEMLQSAYTTLETVTPVEDAEYQWQILADDVWVDIMGATEPQIRVSYAMVANLLDRHDAVSLRCEIIDGDDVSYTDPVEVCVEFGSDDVIIDAEAEEEPVEEFEELSEEDPVQEEIEETAGEPLALFALPEEPGTVTEDAPFMLLAEEGGSAMEKYNIIIEYKYENGDIAAATYIAEVIAGNDFKEKVKSPSVQGYLPYIGTESADTVLLDYPAVSKNDIITVTYKPTNVEYTVIYYHQDVLTNKYVEKERETFEGLTGSVVGLEIDEDKLNKAYEGFYQLPYPKPKIAADGSTVVEIYYDRYYYLLSFDLTGGYGTEPIYARYGSSLTSVVAPIRAGYTFGGWSLDGTDIVTLPSTMPAENCRYKAVWEADDTAKVTFVFWGENPNDEEYSYLESIETTAKPGTVITYGTDNRICGQEEHTHDANCQFACGIEEHKHSLQDNCYTLKCTQASHSHTNDGCALDCKHIHAVECYTADNDTNLKEISKPNETLTSIGNGIYTYYTYSSWGWNTHYVLNIGSKWYCSDGRYRGDRNSITFTCSHIHTDTCYTCGKIESAHQHSIANGCYELTCTEEEHMHSETCDYSCGKFAHTHSDACKAPTSSEVEANLWTLVRSDTVTVDANGTTVVNVYYDRTSFTMTFKEQGRGGKTLGSITDKWGADIKTRFETISKENTFFWSAKQDGGSPWTSFMDVMPAENRTYYADPQGGNSTITATYLAENLAETGYETLYTVSFQGSSTVTVTEEEFVEIEGFTFNDSRTTDTGEYYNGAKFYYDRHHYAIEFFNPTTLLRKTTGITYEAPLGTYDWTPDPADAPSKYEPGSMVFEGWYLNPECTGDKFNFKTHTMPAGTNDGDTTLTLYAKWEAKEHTVRFFFTEKDYVNGKVLENATFQVSNGLTVDADEDVPDEQVEVLKNLKKGDAKMIAWFYRDANGNERAFDIDNMPVKQDLDLYAKWDSGAFMDYVIYYQLESTGESVNEPEIIAVADKFNGFAHVGDTITFEAKGGTDLYPNYQMGYFPKVKSHSITIAEDETTGEWYPTGPDGKKEQSYTFYYVQKESVPYKVEYIDKASGKPMSEENPNIEDIIVTNNKYAVVNETFKMIPGYVPDAYQKTLVVVAEGEDEDQDGVIDSNVIRFYYTKDDSRAYYKESHYTEMSGGNWEEYTGSTALSNIGATVTASAIEIPGFTFNPNAEGTLTSGKVTADGLHLKLYYTRNRYPYKVMYVDRYSGEELALAKIAYAPYETVVSESPINIQDYAPVSTAAKTLVIRMETVESLALNVIRFEYERIPTELKIKKIWNCAECYKQDAVFTIKGGELGTNGLRFVIPFDGDDRNDITITGLKAGLTYIVEEEGGWSWRFTAEGAKTIQLAATGNELTFTNTLNNDKIYWFDGSHWKRNHFGDPEETNE